MNRAQWKMVEELRSENKELKKETAKLQHKLDQLHEAYTTDIGKANEVINSLRKERALLKPEWDKIPDLWKWRAYNVLGEEVWFSEKPSIDETYRGWISKGKYIRVYLSTWRETLEHRPEVGDA